MEEKILDFPTYSTEMVSLFIDGKDVECIIIHITVDDLDDYLINRIEFPLLPVGEEVDENNLLVIKNSDMQKYLDFLSDKGLNQMESIPFVINIFSGEVISPEVVAGAELSNLLISTLSFPLKIEINGVLNNLKILQLPYNLVDIFLSEDAEFSLQGKIKVANPELKGIYLDYKKRVKPEVNLLNLAFDDSSLRGYVVEVKVKGKSYYDFYDLF